METVASDSYLKVMDGLEIILSDKTCSSEVNTRFSVLIHVK